MRFRAPRAAAIIILFLAAAALFPYGARPARGASLFSLYGLGETLDLSSGRGRALGGMNAALDDSMRPSIDNPAQVGAIDRVSFSALFVAERRSAQSSLVTEDFTDGNFPSVTFAIPIRRFAVLGFGFLREQTIFVNPLVVQSIIDPSPHSLRFKRDGDVFRIPIGLARQVHPRVTAGFSLDLWYGSVDEERTVDFAAPEFHDTHDLSSEESDGVGLSFGVVAQPLDRAVVGIRYRGETALDGTRTLTTIDGGATHEPARETMPASLALGGRFDVSPRIAALFEARRDYWAGTEGDVSVTGGYADATRVGGGVELRPSEGHGGLGSVPWRVGYRWAEWPYRDPSGDKISEWLVSGGTSLPLGGDIGVVDLFLEYGNRGSQDTNGLEEGLFRFGIGFAAGEPWRMPRKGRRGGVPNAPPTY